MNWDKLINGYTDRVIYTGSHGVNKEVLWLYAS